MDDGPMKRTNLSTSAGISYDNFMEYLEWMISRELVVENDGQVHITQKGMRTYNELVNWIITYVGKLKFGRRI